ncbi:MAG: molecular chaperone DnaJ [Parcubacteria group bacterium]|nr:molecular chaperone DnaJ [Parcubacteria group bacterium]
MPHQNYYATLGVEKNASKDEIKKAFHKLARKYHPDNKAGGDEKKFKEINEAYQVLSNEKRRAEYDTYGQAFAGSGFGGGPGFAGFDFSGFNGQGFGGVEFDIGDIFGDIFGGGGGRERTKRGRDISIDLEVSFKDGVFGTDRSVLLTKTSPCDSCIGTGAATGTTFTKCVTCNGQGRVQETRNSFFGTFTNVKECSVCRGKGEVPKQVCAVCRGAGVVRKQEEIAIKIPPGMQDGEVIRLSQMGEAISGGISGDLYVRVHVSKHPIFKREGKNIVTTLDIKLTDALLGTEYALETLDGPITFKVPANASFGEILRIRNKGIPTGPGKRGDLLVKINIRLPKNLSKKAQKLFEELKKEGI